MSAKHKNKVPQSIGKRKTHTPQKSKIVQKKSGINRRNFFIVLIIMLVTFIVFSPALKNQFTNWDDTQYIIENIHVKSLSFDKVVRHFTTFTHSNYHPLVLLSYSISYHFGQMDPVLYHATNVIFHVLNTLLVFLFIYLLSGRRQEVAIIVALGFGIHPMHVESVAWISELKDVMYGFFFIAAMIFYYKFINPGKKKSLFYALSLIMFILSLFSKSAAVSLPGVLILMDFYQGRKFNTRVIIEKIPFILLSLVFGYIAIMSQEEAIGKLEALTIFQRFIFASYGFVMYIVKFVAPVNLSAFYPYPVTVFPIKEALPIIYYLSPVIVISIFAGLYFSYKKTRLFIFGILFYFVTIALVLQLITVGKAIMADRYSYIPYIGLLFLVAMLYSKYFHSKKGQFNKFKIPVLLVLIIYGSVFFYASFERTKIWKNSLILFTDVIEKYPNVETAYKNRGNYYARVTQEYDKALVDFNKYITLDPTEPLIFSNRGNLHGLMGNFELALADYSRSAELDSTKVDTYVNKGVTYIRMEQYDKAIPEFNKAEQIEPSKILIYSNRAYAYLQAGMYEESVKDYEYVIANDVTNSDNYFYKGIANFRLNRFQEAVNDNTTVLQINPNNGGAYLNRSLAYRELGEYQKALDDGLKAKEMGQNLTDVYFENLRKELLR